MPQRLIRTLALSATVARGAVRTVNASGRFVACLIGRDMLATGSR